MGQIRIITDNSFGYHQAEGGRAGCDCGSDFYQIWRDRDADGERGRFPIGFSGAWLRRKELPTTSQPSPELYLKEYNEAKEKGEDVLVLTLSSGLSGTINAARLAKDMCGYDRIFIVDTRQAIIPQQMLVEYAVRQRAQGVGAEEIAEKIEDVRDRMVVCGVLDTLTYLRKGGRIPPGFDVLGNVLKIKPVIELKDGILVKLGVARGMRKGKDYLFREYEACEIDEEWPVVTGLYLRQRKRREVPPGSTGAVSPGRMPAVAGGWRDRNPCGRELPGPGICQKGTGLNAIEDVAFCKKATSSIKIFNKVR